MQIDPTFAKDLKKADLRYIGDTTAGITRKHNNKSFKYFDSGGKNIQSKIIINRIEKLAIPPAWVNVWICPSPSGYLQATGFDGKGRKQYIYHSEWVKISQENKLIPHFENIYKNYQREKIEVSRNEFATLTLLRKYS